jgi:ATP-dependent exoDNAse (exonuclease V) beta subunit
VIRSVQPSFVVSAAAGAGKTFVLVERYLRHIEEGEADPDQILTITFTKKAAAEMKSRIVNGLRERKRFVEAQEAETGPIQTIHSFCERLLRENALEGGLDPQFEILSESASARLVTECVREALSSPLEDEPQAQELLASLAGKRRYGDGSSPYAVLEAGVVEVVSQLRGSGITALEVQNRHLEPDRLCDIWEEALLRQADEAVRAAFPNIQAATFRERLQMAYKATTNRVPGWLRGPHDEKAEREARVHACGLVQLACAAWWRLEREMDARQQLDFTELERRGVKLLQTSEVTRKRLADQYKVVMVDESQDLNPQQYLLLQSLNPRVEMFVGDAQQSIYGFRQADRHLFLAHAAERPTLYLSKNHRSEDGILNLVDKVFGQFWGADYSPMNAKPFDFEKVEEPCFEGIEIWRHMARDTSVTVGYIRELLEEGALPKDIAVLTRDTASAVDLRDAMVRADIPSRIVGGSERFYTRLEVRDLANTLRAVADPHDDFALLACLRSPMVGVTLDTIFLLGREPNVVERLPSFVPTRPEDAEKLARFLKWYLPLKAYADRLSAWEVLAEIFARSDYLESLAKRDRCDQLLANARKLLTLAAQEPELGPLDYAERIREIQDLRHKEGDAPASADDADEITIMTIHKAKGLEFPIVVLPQTWKRLVSSAPDLLVDARQGIVTGKYGKEQCLMHKFLAESRKQQATDEELRVLYVALTRAKSRLCICLYPTAGTDTISKRLAGILKDPLPGMKVRDATQA